MDTDSNVTFRRMRRHNSENDLTHLNSTIANNSRVIIDESMRSLPDVSICNNSRIIDLEMQVEQIRQTLSTANQEVDILTIENSSLKREIKNCNLIIKSLNSIQSPVPKRLRCQSPTFKNSEKIKRQLFALQIQACDVAVQTETHDPTPRKPVKKLNRKIKLSLKPKNKYLNKRLLKKLRMLKRKVKNLQKELDKVEIDKNRIQHKILECATKNKIQKSGDEIPYKRLFRNIEKKRVNIFSDSLGSGMAIRMLEQSGSIEVINHCKPGARSGQILSNFYQQTKNLQGNDLAVIMIGNYNETKMEIPYIEIVRNILKNNSRNFNILLGSIIYDGKNDSTIYKINTELARLATVSEKVKYQELNKINRNLIKTFMSGEIIRTCKNFKSSSCLQFIKPNSDLSSNFLKTSKIVVNG